MTNLFPKIFVDFDGTITKQDVGNAFFRTFGDEEEAIRAVAKWKNGEISGSELTLIEAERVKVSEEQALSYVGSFEIDSSFKTFLSFCKENGVGVIVLSDGLDFYIKKIFAVNGLPDVSYFSNRAQFDQNGIKIEFPYESDCSKCANCKGHQILTMTGSEDLIVYIGNGFSDRCAVQYADIVFAKDELLKYCEESNITYFPFDNFGEVLVKFKKIFDARNFRKRHRAELKRREAYLAE